jgi:hypothetical protein
MWRRRFKSLWTRRFVLSLLVSCLCSVCCWKSDYYVGWPITLALHHFDERRHYRAHKPGIQPSDYADLVLVSRYLTTSLLHDDRLI